MPLMQKHIILGGKTNLLESCLGAESLLSFMFVGYLWHLEGLAPIPCLSSPLTSSLDQLTVSTVTRLGVIVNSTSHVIT